jgi:preprotein translocase subunit SecG
MEATSTAAALYFVIVVFFGCFFIINLVLAVVSMSYTNEVRHIE